MSDLRVVCGGDAALDFARPVRVLRAASPAEARDALDEAERLRRDGLWIAGYVSYELGAAFAYEPVRPTSWPLLALGAYERARPLTDDDTTARPFALLPSATLESYAQRIESIRRAIFDGDVYQVNFTVPFALDEERGTLAWWRAIARATGARYQAYVEDAQRRICSWSPELFLAFAGNRIETRPMKGTATHADAAALSNAKNRAEHVMIVDLLRNDLHRICNDVRVERLFEVEMYPTYVTMTSTIAGTLRDETSLREIFEATFPCGSVTGAPKRAAIAAIAALEPQTRDAYCGTIGYLSPERRGWWNVAIRTAQFDPNDGIARFDAGGGIVADSNAHAEWDELHVKTAFLRAGSGISVLETFASDADDERFERHLARMLTTLERLGAHVDGGRLREELTRARGGAHRLVRARAHTDGRVSIMHAALDRPNEPVCVFVSTQRVRSSDPFLRVKTSHRAPHDAVAAQARERGCFDGLLRNERGELTEGSRTNLFLERDGALLTPPLEAGVLPGILREMLVSEGRARECTLTIDDLERASAVYVGNSARGLLRAVVVKDPL